MTHSVGDTVYADFGQYGRIEARRGRVIRVTPTGQITVNFGLIGICRFKNGWMIGGETYNRPHLITADEYARLFEMQNATQLADEITARLRSFKVTTRAETIAAFKALIALAEGLPE